jgi:hypothetical protein
MFSHLDTKYPLEPQDSELPATQRPSKLRDMASMVRQTSAANGKLMTPTEQLNYRLTFSFRMRTSSLNPESPDVLQPYALHRKTKTATRILHNAYNAQQKLRRQHI